MGEILTKNKKKIQRDNEEINKPMITPDQDAIMVDWGMISAVVSCITGLLSASVLIYTIVRYLQIAQ